VMRVGAYRMHFKKSGQHVKNGIPPYADILQELQGFGFDNFRCQICEPPFFVAIYDSMIEGELTLT